MPGKFRVHGAWRWSCHLHSFFAIRHEYFCRFSEQSPDGTGWLRGYALPEVLPCRLVFLADFATPLLRESQH